MREMFVSVAVMGILFMSGSVTTSETLEPLWRYKIENITNFAMSRNGEYIIVACEKGPLCEEKQYYVFDRYGNTVTYGCIDSEITVVEICDNGAFFIGTRTGYYLSSDSGRIYEDLDMGSIFQAASMSQNGEIVIAGTEKEILIFDKYSIKNVNEVGRPANFTAISASGDVAVAATNDGIFLHRESNDTWAELTANGTITALTVSGDGSTAICGMSTGMIWILDSQLKIQETLIIAGEVNSVAATIDGGEFVCGTRKGRISYYYSTGNEVWSSEVGNIVYDMSLSFDGKLLGVLSESITVFDFSGKKIQELKSSEVIRRMYLAKSGEILSYITDGELVIVELCQQSIVYTYEYKLPSRRSIPLDDELKMDWSYGSNPLSAYAADVNGDGQKEIICSFNQEIVVLTSRGEVLWKKSLTFQFGFNVLDVTGDFISEIIITSTDNRMGFHIFNGEGQELSGHEFYPRWFSVPPPQEIGVVMWANWSGDIDNDGLMEVVCLVSSGYYLEPRGIYAFEYPSFKEEWYYPMADIPERINFVDINGDGQAEIISGSNAPCNGRSVGNTDDCHAYVYAVTLEGKELWTKQIGPEGYRRVHIAVADLEGDGDLEIVGSGWSFGDDWGALFILGPGGNYISGKENEFEHSVFLEGVADLNNDGNLEILTSIPGSTVALYDYKLREIKRQNTSVKTGKLTVVRINDIDADGEKEVILTSDDKKLLILNSDLNSDLNPNLEEEQDEVFPTYSVSPKAFVVNLNNCKNHILVVSDKLYAYTYFNNPPQPCIPWAITQQEKINELRNSLEETSTYLEQEDLEKAADCVSHAEEVYMSIRSEGGLAEYYKEIEAMKNAIEASSSKIPPPALSETPPLTASSIETSEPTPNDYRWPLVLIVMILGIISFLTLRKFFEKGEIHDLMVLSLEKRDKTLYQVALESVRGTIHPVKSTRTIDISSEMRSEMIARIDCASRVINTFLSLGKEPKKTVNELERMGTVIYKNFIPRDFASKFVHHYIVLEVEDVQIPWELMYDGEFFALKYAVSRRIKSEKVLAVPKMKRREKKALLIADPTERLPGAVRECEYLKDHLQGYFTTTYL
ncbi:MAG: VCBS repeat-containing protein, partial [Theionarchaea archaeon]|nr:VCBS repeat-containing protein [Theionarchaea archaeon]